MVIWCLLASSVMTSVFFFFQAEDGIRDKLVTGVQTCALPICVRGAHPPDRAGGAPRRAGVPDDPGARGGAVQPARQAARRARPGGAGRPDDRGGARGGGADRAGVERGRVRAAAAPQPVLHARRRHREEQVGRSEEHTSELQSLAYLVCRLLLEKKKKI